ncbi:hypothetical protein, partial [Burkholderia stabilis]
MNPNITPSSRIAAPLKNRVTEIWPRLAIWYAISSPCALSDCQLTGRPYRLCRADAALRPRIERRVVETDHRRTLANLPPRR